MRLLTFIVSMVLVMPAVFSQHKVIGTVSDKQTGQFLADAFVYFPELHKGAVTSSEGQFEVEIANATTVLMQVSHIGYQSYFFNLQLPLDSVIKIALQPSLIQMREVVVTGNKSFSPDETSFHVLQLSSREMQQQGALSISDALARLPGASQLTTGAGISKPVIRGLYGNRIQVNVNGVRFDNQQWQDEHGLGLSDMGVDRIEIIKGPASVLYGADAMGGVLNVIEEKPSFQNGTTRDMTVKLYSNTYGLSLNAGQKRTQGNRWKRFRVGFDNHADYSGGDNKRVLNSRFATYNMKLSAGVNRVNRSRVNNLFASYSKFGFVFDSLARKEKDGRLSRTFDGAHHEVFLLQGTSENTLFRGSRKIRINGGMSSNLRMEDEGGGGISLSMLLNSINLTGQIEQPLGGNSELYYGGSLMGQTNTNFGGRIIIPDALTGEASVFGLYRYKKRPWLLETGARYDYKFIGTFATGSLNIVGNESPTQEIVPFNRFYNALNFTAGTTLTLTKNVSGKLNASTGYRPGNLAELSSNGLHEGTLRWEIGKQEAAIEQNLNTEVSLVYSGNHFRATIAVYQNRFWNYFYLAPTGAEYFGFRVYHFEQADATLKGGEVTADWNPSGTKIELNSSYSIISAKKDDGEYLPFIPANRLNGGIRYYLSTASSTEKSFVRAGFSYTFSQTHPAEFETKTSDYLLMDASTVFFWKNAQWTLSCNNLLNKSYYDHLSRFKYYGIYNMGRNIVLTVNIKLTKS